jgi:hypothetical protein
MKTWMKTVACSALLLLALSSCSGNNDVLTESAAEKALKKADFLAKDSQLSKFQTGYYEVSKELLDRLAKLKAANMITLRVDEKTEIKKTYWRTVESLPHYFVAVELTEEGKKFERDEHKYVPEYLEKYIKANKNYEAKLPAYMDSVYVVQYNNSEECNITDEDQEAMEKYLKELDDNPSATPQANEGKDSSDGYDPHKDYLAAKAKVQTEDHWMLVFQCKLNDVYEVKCDKEKESADTGSCKFVFELTDVTPFGYTFFTFDKQYRFGNASFVRYEDLGWRIRDVNFE